MSQPAELVKIQVSVELECVVSSLDYPDGLSTQEVHEIIRTALSVAGNETGDVIRLV